MGCATTKENVGFEKICIDMALIKGHIITPGDFEFTNVTTALTQAGWSTAIQANWADRIVPFPPVKMVEDVAEETIYEDLATGVEFVREGKRAYRLTHSGTLEFTKKARSFNGSGDRIFFIDTEGRVIGTSDDGVNFRGFSLDLLHVEKMKLNDGSVGAKTNVYVVFEDGNELDDRGLSIKPSWNPLRLKSLIDITLTESGTSTTSLITVKVDTTHSNQVQGGNPVYGLLITDFKVLSAAGVSQSFTFEDNEDGTYALAFTIPLTAGTYSVSMVNAWDMTSLGYEGANTLSIILS